MPVTTMGWVAVSCALERGAEIHARIHGGEQNTLVTGLGRLAELGSAVESPTRRVVASGRRSLSQRIGRCWGRAGRL